MPNLQAMPMEINLKVSTTVDQDHNVFTQTTGLSARVLIRMQTILTVSREVTKVEANSVLTVLVLTVIQRVASSVHIVLVTTVMLKVANNVHIVLVTTARVVNSVHIVLVTIVRVVSSAHSVLVRVVAVLASPVVHSYVRVAA